MLPARGRPASREHRRRRAAQQAHAAIVGATARSGRPSPSSRPRPLARRLRHSGPRQRTRPGRRCATSETVPDTRLFTAIEEAVVCRSAATTTLGSTCTAASPSAKVPSPWFHTGCCALNSAATRSTSPSCQSPAAGPRGCGAARREIERAGTPPPWLRRSSSVGSSVETRGRGHHRDRSRRRTALGILARGVVERHGTGWPPRRLGGTEEREGTCALGFSSGGLPDGSQVASCGRRSPDPLRRLARSAPHWAAASLGTGARRSRRVSATSV
jgi:hypothetical protein